MRDRLWAATGEGVREFERKDGEWQDLGLRLADQDATCLAGSGTTLLAGTTHGVFRSADGGATWREAGGVTVPHARWIAIHPEHTRLALVGTEPAAIFRSEDGGATWHECPEVTSLRQRGRWFLPYSPESGCIRGLAFHGQRVYAAAEVGGALRSDDEGRTWRLTRGSSGEAGFDPPPEPYIHPDVHSVSTHPSSPDLVFAPTGGGFYTSADGGVTWRSRYECYCRAVWADPADPQHLLLGPADDVDADGRIEETHDGGATWTPASSGLKVPWRKHMVERFADLEGELLAVLSNGHVLAASTEDLVWRRVLAEAGEVRALAGGR